jgi:hypothetical protein
MIDKRDDELDRMLDEALASYSAQDPWPGLAQRVMARLEPKERAAWWRWAVPALALGGVVAAIVIHSSRPVPAPVRVSQIQAVPAPLAPRPEARAAQVRPKRLRVKPAAPPRREVFPTPSPLTEEERALLQLVTRSPEVLDEALALRARQTEPLAIEPLYIPPLSNGG